MDSQTDENLKAFAEVLGGVSGLTNPGERIANPNGNATAPSFRVKASNVPIGYYESVIGTDACGKKRLYGFRYIGFIPYDACPVVMSGCQTGSCQTTELYGLVFEQGTMVFRPLHHIQSIVESTEMVERTSELPRETSLR